MLLNDFFTYKVVDKEEGKWSCQIDFNAEHEIYKGHFPGLPITPGVCQVQIVQEVISDLLKSNYRLKGARDIKFLNFIDPQKTSSLSLELAVKQKDEDGISVTALMVNEGVNFFKMRSTFEK